MELVFRLAQDLVFRQAFQQEHAHPAVIAVTFAQSELVLISLGSSKSLAQHFHCALRGRVLLCSKLFFFPISSLLPDHNKQKITGTTLGVSQEHGKQQPHEDTATSCSRCRWEGLAIYAGSCPKVYCCATQTVNRPKQHPIKVLTHPYL